MRVAAALLLLGAIVPAAAQETLCARVKIEIKQELTLERQAFDAEMKINNTLDNASLTEVSVIVKVTDEQGVAVPISSDPNNETAKFFVRVSDMDNILAVDGSGTVAPSTTAAINWLLIPSATAAGDNPFGKKYLVGAALQYKFGAETHTLDVSPDVITVKPLPKLTLDYFLTKDVIGDDPFTEPVELPEPFTLGVRIKNTGLATAKTLKIDSAQPKITENQQGLLVNFKLTGSYVDDAPVQNTLLIDFGDVLPSTAKMGRWLMESSLTGTFTEFTARFTHSDELGGALTSLLQATNTHFLIRDVRVDLPGRDFTRDFLARDTVGGTITVYESEGADTQVTDLSASSTLTAGQNDTYVLTTPATQGFVYARLADPYGGTKALGTVVRSDAKAMLPENIWLSRAKNTNTNNWEYWVNIFDVNSPGSYSTPFTDPPNAPQPPVIQYVPDHQTIEGQAVSFVVEASSPDGKALTLSAAPLPTGATFTSQDTGTVGLARSTFSWTPTQDQYGDFLIVYTATDGNLSTAKSATVRVDIAVPTTPGLKTPATGAHVANLQPTLSVETSQLTYDRTAQVQFEIYGDEAFSQLVESSLVAKDAGGTTSFVPSAPLIDNTMYWWRARAFDGASMYSDWVYGRFFVNLFNDAPDSFSLASPAPGVEVTSATPVLTWSNTRDKDDGDTYSFAVFVYSDAGLSQLVTSATNLAPAEGISTSWTVNVPLTNHATYHWKVEATDNNGAVTTTAAQAFIINTHNTAPPAPVVISPLDGGQVAADPESLTVTSELDAEGDPITYVFELDTVSSFDSPDHRVSGALPRDGSGNTSWSVSGLVENRIYWWRVKAQDGRAESAWTVASFRKNAVNEAPPAPTVRNPGDGAWTGTTTPILEANLVQDPEEEAVTYEFEVYRSSAPTTVVASGSSATGAWTVTPALADKTTHQWRVRAVDTHQAASAWSAFATLYVSTGTWQSPTIEVTTPSAPTVGLGTVSINWNGNDPNIEPTIALYYSTSSSSYSGTLIVDGIRKPAGSHTGSYSWNVSGLPVGTYYVYGVIYDPKGSARDYAPGAVVVLSSTQQQGAMVVSTPDSLSTGPTKSGSFAVRLASAPTDTVTVPLYSSNPREGLATPSYLTFTPADWYRDQMVTVTGTACADAGQLLSATTGLQVPYQILVGPASSVDPNYLGISGQTISVVGDRSGPIPPCTSP